MDNTIYDMILHGNMESILTLLKPNVIHIRDEFGLDPLLLSIYLQKIKVSDYLLSTMGINPNTKDDTGFTALHYAVNTTEIKFVELLLKHGAEVNVINNYMETPLHLAASYNDTEMYNLLIKHGAKSSKNREGLTPEDLLLKK